MHLLNIEKKNVRLIQRVYAKYDQRYLVIIKKSMHILNIEKEKNLRLIQRIHAEYDQRY